MYLTYKPSYEINRLKGNCSRKGGEMHQIILHQQNSDWRKILNNSVLREIRRYLARAFLPKRKKKPPNARAVVTLKCCLRIIHSWYEKLVGLSQLHCHYHIAKR